MRAAAANLEFERAAGVTRQDPGVAQPRLCAVLTGAFPGCECIEWGQGAYGGSLCGFATGSWCRGRRSRRRRTTPDLAPRTRRPR